MDRFVAMTSFRRVVEARGFAAAARQLGLSPAAVTKQIAWLEDELGTRLLHRTTRSVSPSEIGASYYQRCVRILDDLDEAQASARREHAEPRGWIRVAAPVSFGAIYLGGLVARFRARHREVRVEVVLDDRQINPTVEGVDVVVRISRGLADSALVARRLAGMTRIVCAAPSYLAQRGQPRRPEDLASHDCLVYSQVASPQRWQFEAATGALEVEVEPCLAANNSLLLREAVLGGAGVAVMPSYLVRDDLAAGRLRPLLTGYRPVEFDIHALYPRPRQQSARVRAFVDHLAVELPGLVAPARRPRGRR
jgi:DNA-binding transcriptional LysR family regulator